LLFFIAVAGIHMLVALSGHETLTSFIALQTLMMIGFSLIAGNFGAMAMENMGGVAGMANSLQGSMANVSGIIFGTVIGQAFNGTTIPLYIGFFVCGLFALVAVLITERGHLFVARNAPPPTGD
jgi:MFS transporter, DHA1 family, multidrug resistance protein